MGLFDKKYCDICGDKIGLLGNRKLEDGNLCKECAKGLSPFFSERRNSTVAEIKAQLTYREANKQAVAAFHVTRTLGASTKVMFDEDAKKFLVTSASRWQETNPDVLDYSQVTGCILDIDEDQDEEMRRTDDGEQVSYVPPRWTYRYNFWLTIHVRHPYFDEIRVHLNNSSIAVEVSGSRNQAVGGVEIGRRSADYQQCEALAAEIKDELTQVRMGVREEVAAANAPKVAQTCRLCGATTLPNAQGCCEYCGGAMG